MLAAYNGHAALVEGLAARGADPNRVNDRGQSPLAGAVFKGLDAVVRTLLAHGADPHLGTPSAAQTAQMFKRTELLALMGGPAAEQPEQQEQESVPPSTTQDASTPES